MRLWISNYNNKLSRKRNWKRDLTFYRICWNSVKFRTKQSKIYIRRNHKNSKAKWLPNNWPRQDLDHHPEIDPIRKCKINQHQQQQNQWFIVIFRNSQDKNRNQSPNHAQNQRNHNINNKTTCKIFSCNSNRMTKLLMRCGKWK